MTRLVSESVIEFDIHFPGVDDQVDIAGRPTSPIFLRKTANQRKFLIYKRLSIDYTITYRILFDEVIAMNADFSRTLALLRQEKGISQRKAAKELGISQALLSHYENGIREPGLAFVKKACDYYHAAVP